MNIDGIEIIGDITESEAWHYVQRAPKGTTHIICEPDGDYIGLTYCEKVPFERIRRITGYLVGDLKRFNDAKLSEVHDRVKHKVQK